MSLRGPGFESRPTEAGIFNSIVDFILTSFFEFSIKSYKYCEFFSEMENQICERSSFGAVGFCILEKFRYDFF